MKNSSWLKAGIVAAGVGVVLQLINFISNFIPCIACLVLPLSCVAWFLLPLGAGYLAAKWAKLEKDQFTEALKQAALAGLVVGIIVGIVTIGFNFLSSILNLANMTALDSLDFIEDNNSQLSNFLAYSLSLPFQALCCFGILLVDVIFSALGGIIRVATQKE